MQSVKMRYNQVMFNKIVISWQITTGLGFYVSATPSFYCERRIIFWNQQIQKRYQDIAGIAPLTSLHFWGSQCPLQNFLEGVILRSDVSKNAEAQEGLKVGVVVGKGWSLVKNSEGLWLPLPSTHPCYQPGLSHRMCLSLHLTLSRLQRSRGRYCGPCGCDERPSKRRAWAGTLCSDTETSQAPFSSTWGGEKCIKHVRCWIWRLVGLLVGMMMVESGLWFCWWLCGDGLLYWMLNQRLEGQLWIYPSSRSQIGLIWLFEHLFDIYIYIYHRYIKLFFRGRQQIYIICIYHHIPYTYELISFSSILHLEDINTGSCFCFSLV